MFPQYQQRLSLNSSLYFHRDLRENWPIAATLSSLQTAISALTGVIAGIPDGILIKQALIP